MTSIKSVWKNLIVRGSESSKKEPRKIQVRDDFKLRIHKNLPNELLVELTDLNRNINDSGKSLEEQGYRDGSIGVESNEYIKERITAITSYLLAPVKAMAIGICEGLIREIESLNQEITRRENDQKIRRERHDLISNEYNMNSTQFSLFLGVFYCIVALLLILADVPLAVELTKQGFELNGIVGEDQSEMPYLATNPLNVIRSNWEVFVLAIGIALSTIYFKIYYDFLIGKSTFREVIFDKHLNTQFKFDEKDWKRINDSRRVKASVSFGLLVLTITTMFVLGFFRFEAMENGTAESLNDLQGLLSTPGDQDDETVDLTDAIQPVSWITKLAFVLVTVLFPVIGGVCASIGLKMIHKFFGKSSSQIGLSISSWFLHGTRKRKNKKDVKLSSWRSHLYRFLDHQEQEKWNNGELNTSSNSGSDEQSGRNQLSRAEQEVYNYLYSSYINGVNEGINNPQSHIEGVDLFNKVVELRDRHKSKLFNKSLGYDKSA